MEKLIEFKNMNFAYTAKSAFSDFNIEVMRGDIVTLIGTNGSGKTTLLKMLCKRLPNESVYYKGVCVKDHDVKELQREIVVIFDSPIKESVIENELKRYLLMIGLTNEEIDSRIDSISKFFNIESLLKKRVKELNMSERNLIKILRYLIINPVFLAVDNMISMLDPLDIKKFFEYIKKNKITLLNVTNDLNQSLYGNKIFVLDDFVLILEGSTTSVLKADTLLKRLGFKLPLAVELSIELGHYDLLNKIYTDKEKLVNALWK